MRYVGIDLHKQDLVVAIENESGPVGHPVRIRCEDESDIVSLFEKQVPFEAVIEASSSYRWLYKLLSPLGHVVLAHPLRLRGMVTRRAKTDKLDAAYLAKTLRRGEIPEAYIPPERYQQVRELTRARARLSQAAAAAKNQMRALLRGANVRAPYRNPFGVRGRGWLRSLDLGLAGNLTRDELVDRVEHYERARQGLDAGLAELAKQFPEREALLDLYGIGLFSAMLIIGELGEVERFRESRQVGAYAGLTARVHQSGGHDYHGHITRQGSGWLRWVLQEAAIKIIRQDTKLRNMYTRIRKRSGKNIARTAVARKLAGICWVRLRRWHREHPTEAIAAAD